MIPILYGTQFTGASTPGYGPMEDVISCTVVEELNGEFFLRMTYPATGVLFRKIDVNCIILAEPGDGRNRQPFQITEITRNLNGLVEIFAPHISHQLNYFFTKPFEIPVSPGTGTILAQSLMSSLQSMVIDSISALPFNFTFSADAELTSPEPYIVDYPKSIRSVLGRGEDSALAYFGGELEWDVWAVKLKKRRGKETNVEIDYGKNLTRLKATKNTDGMCQAVIPFWFRAATEDKPKRLERLSSYVIIGSESARNPFAHTVPLDLSRVIDEETLGVGDSAERLIASYAQNWLSDHNQMVPTFSSDVGFVPLWQTDEFAGVKSPERVQLGDSVLVKHEPLMYQNRLRIVKTEYDVLHERYTGMEMGNLRDTLTKKITEW